MPDTPTSGVKGQVWSSPALQASMSMLSFAPAATTFGWLASIATAGSFCLFCENGLGGLPTETRVSWANAALAVAASTRRTSTAIPAVRRRIEPPLTCLQAEAFLFCPGRVQLGGERMGRERQREQQSVEHERPHGRKRDRVAPHLAAAGVLVADDGLEARPHPPRVDQHPRRGHADQYEQRCQE